MKTTKKRFIIEEIHSYYSTVKIETLAETKEEALENYNDDVNVTEISNGSLNGSGVEFDKIYQEDE